MEIQNLRKVIFGLGAFLYSMVLFSQDEFYVYSHEGTPYLEINDSIKPITRGLDIKKGAILNLGKIDAVSFITKEGELYRIEEEGSYPYVKLSGYKEKKEASSYAKKYLAYVCEQFLNKAQDNRSRSGVIYRGDTDLLMEFPSDSALVIANEVKFKWYEKENKTKEYYLVLRDVETDHYTTIGTPANTLTLKIDNNLLKSGKTYQWAITETMYPNLDNIRFYNFNISTKEEVERLIPEIKNISEYLKREGLTSTEIQGLMCKVYKVCY